MYYVLCTRVLTYTTVHTYSRVRCPTIDHQCMRAASLGLHGVCVCAHGRHLVSQDGPRASGRSPKTLLPLGSGWPSTTCLGRGVAPPGKPFSDQTHNRPTRQQAHRRPIAAPADRPHSTRQASAEHAEQRHALRSQRRRRRRPHWHARSCTHNARTILARTHRPQFFFRTADVTGTCHLQQGVEMVRAAM